MSGVMLNNIRTPLVPIIKRATGRLSDGRSIALWIDANKAGDGAEDSGVAKIFLWLSGDQFRTDFGPLLAARNPQVPTPIVAYTPPVPPCSLTVRAVASLAVGTDNKVWVTWVGTDNSLHLTSWVYTPGAAGARGTFGAAVDQVVVAANGITNRFRTIDLDIAGADNPIIAAYEAMGASGLQARARAYVRMNGGTTWVMALDQDLITNRFIYTDTEEISISWSLDGIVSNVGKFLIYWEACGTDWDYGARVREYQFNTSTGTAGSATFRGEWFAGQNLNHDQSVTQRRGWIYKVTSGAQAMWLMAGVVGATTPRTWATKLTTGIWTPPIVTQYQVGISRSMTDLMRIDTSNGPRVAVGCQYADNRLVFGFVGYSRTQPRLFREVMFRYQSPADYNIAFVDTMPRPLDGDGIAGKMTTVPMGIYGGDNSRTAVSPGQFNWVAVYPWQPGRVIGEIGEVRNVAEDVPKAPRILSPGDYGVEPSNRPTFRVAVDPGTSPPSHYAKVEIQLATDSAFTANLRTALQPDSEFRYYGSIEERIAGETVVTIPGTLLNQPLFTSGWSWRARMVTDKGQVGPWSAGYAGTTFSVAHAPTCTPISPKESTVQDYGAGNAVLTWDTTDPEPTDSQSAYNVVLTRMDTGAVVTDTGWVVSSAKTATIAVVSTLKDTPLQWKVRAKDIDGSIGSFSRATQFTLGTLPTVAVTAPTGGTTALNPNPGFETNTTGWTANQGTVARDTAQFHGGVASALMTATGGFASQYLETDKFDIKPGVDYYASAWARTATAWAGGASVSFNWFKSDLTYISTTQVGSVASLAAATWTNLAGSIKPPATAAKGTLLVSQTGTPAAAAQFSIDDASFGYNQVTTAMPTFSWSFTGFGARTQRSYRVVVTDITTGIVVGDSLWIVGTGTSYTFTNQILVNNTSYSVTVYVQDTGDLRSSATTTFITSWIHPAQPTTMTLAQDGFKTTVNWSGGQDPGFIAWRVWRRYRVPALTEMDFSSSSSVWELVGEFSDPSVLSFRDYRAPLNKPADYAVTQVVDRFGSPVDSIITTIQTITCKSDRYYFVPENLVGTIASYQASFVTADSFTDEVEQETIHVIGRGRQVQVGDDLGYIGTLTIKLRNPSSARADREFLEYLASSNTNNVYIRSPFGDVLLVKLGNVGFARLAGVGTTDNAGNIADLGDLTVPYSEVISNVTRVTRLNS